MDYSWWVFILPRITTAGSHFAYAELLKAHRAEYMYRDLGMLEVPIMHGQNTDLYTSQVMCTLVPFIFEHLQVH